MPLDLDDGYTLPLETPDELTHTATGRVIESGLVPIRGRYRPPLFHEIAAYDFAVGRAASGEEQAKVMAEFLAAHIVNWDVTYQGRPTEPTAEFIRYKLPDPYVNLLLRECLKWAPKEQEKAAGNS